MNRMGRAAMMCAVGAVILRLVWSGGFGWFVQQHMRWPLLGAGIVLVVLGVVEARRASREEKVDDHARDHPVAPGVGWLLTLPLVVLVAVAPTGLGAAAAGRVAAYTPVEAATSFDPIPDSGGPVDLRVFDFVDRAIWDPDRSLADRDVVLEGLVVNDDDVADGFRLTRFLVSCCAADGIPVQVTLRGVDEPLPDDTWVRVVVRWREPETPLRDLDHEDRVVEADIVSLTVTDVPSDPYESPY